MTTAKIDKPATELSPEDLHQKITHKVAGQRGLSSTETYSEAHFTYVCPETGQTLLHALALGADRNDLSWFKNQNDAGDDQPGRIFSLINVDALDHDGYTALMRCQQRLARPDLDRADTATALKLYEMLLDNGADHAATLPGARPPMDMALQQFHGNDRCDTAAQIISLLIEHDADFPDCEFPAVLTIALLYPRKKLLGILAERLDGNSDVMKSYLGGDRFFENLVLLSIDQQRYWRGHHMPLYFSPDLASSGNTQTVFQAAHALGISLLGRNAEGRTLHEIATELGILSFMPHPMGDSFAQHSLTQVLRLQTRERLPSIDPSCR